MLFVKYGTKGHLLQEIAKAFYCYTCQCLEKLGYSAGCMILIHRLAFGVCGLNSLADFTLPGN